MSALLLAALLAAPAAPRPDAMQAEVNERTKELSDKKADPAMLTESEREELQALQREQRAIADLIEEYTRREKDQQGEKK